MYKNPFNHSSWLCFAIDCANWHTNTTKCLHIKLKLAYFSFTTALSIVRNPNSYRVYVYEVVLCATWQYGNLLVRPSNHQMTYAREQHANVIGWRCTAKIGFKIILKRDQMEPEFGRVAIPGLCRLASEEVSSARQQTSFQHVSRTMFRRSFFINWE